MTIHHLACLSLERLPEGEDLAALRAKFKQLIGGIPGVESVNIGLNIRPDSSGQFNLAASVRFRDRAALEAFGPRANHLACGAMMGGYGLKALILDFED
jgi:hypothetical protein